MFKLVVSVRTWEKRVVCQSYAEAEGMQDFYQELYPDATITIEPSF